MPREARKPRWKNVAKRKSRLNCHLMKLAHLLVLGSACLLGATAVQAQWQWVDQNNKKVFSDQAPPPDIPDKNILRRPGPASSRLSFSPAPAAAPDADRPLD